MRFACDRCGEGEATRLDSASGIRLCVDRAQCLVNEEARDLREAHAAIEEAKRLGTKPRQQVKAELGL